MTNSVAGPDKVLLQISKPKAADSQVFKPPLVDRIAQRRPVTRQVEFAVRTGRLGVGANIGCEMVDASEEGFGLRLKESVPVGRELTIELIPPGAYRPLRLVAEVRWCQPTGDGTFRAGVWLKWRLPSLTVLSITQ
jgi:hypothetical protein